MKRSNEKIESGENYLMNAPIITVIICCYNGESRIGTVLEKIISQDQVERFVREVIVVDNCSTDRTKEIILEYSEQSVQIPIRYVYENHSGLSHARKKGITECTTEWIAFLDDDNYIEDKWFEYVYDYIDKHPKVGVFNGAVIPLLLEEASQEDIFRLKASIKVLACTHYSVGELQKNPRTPFRNPIGAGMVIKTKPLKELVEKGWLNSAGRTKDNLSSGEDGEMAFWVKEKGYDFGFCPQAVLYHGIPQTRLRDEYLNRMWYEIGRGVAIVAKQQSYSKVKNLLYRVVLMLRQAKNNCNSNLYIGKYYRRYIEGYKNEWK